MPIVNQGAGPHIHSKDSIPRIMWTVLLSLVPAVGAAPFVSGFPAFRVLVVASSSAILAEMGAQKILGRRPSVYDGSAFVTALLFALFLPPHLASWKVALGAAFGIIFGKQVFGGLGQNPFNPALVGCAFVFAAFSSSRDFSLDSAATAQSLPLAAGVLGGGLFLLLKGRVHWEIPLLYLAGYVLLSLASGPGEKGNAIFWPLLLAAFFMVTDPVTTPLTRMGEQWFALGAGVLSALFTISSTPFEGITCAILLMNAVNPWLDRQFRPSGGKKALGLFG